jgi:hypothetical protein
MADKKDGAHANGNGKRVLGPQDVKRAPEIKEFEFPGYDGVFRIKKMGWRELEEIQLAALVTVPGPNGTSTVKNERRMYIPRIVAGCWVDEKGERYFKTIGEAEQLADGDVDLITSLFNAASEVNALSEEVRAELGKDSSSPQTVSGGSSSVPKN